MAATVTAKSGHQLEYYRQQASPAGEWPVVAPACSPRAGSAAGNLLPRRPHALRGQPLPGQSLRG